MSQVADEHPAGAASSILNAIQAYFDAGNPADVRFDPVAELVTACTHLDRDKTRS